MLELHVQNVEQEMMYKIHHTKALKSLETKSSLELYKRGIEIPQIPLCRPCHLKIHHGN